MFSALYREVIFFSKQPIVYTIFGTSPTKLARKGKGKNLFYEVKQQQQKASCKNHFWKQKIVCQI